MSAKASSGTVRGEVIRKVETPQEYKEAVAHAEALGLELESVEGYGSWEAHDGEPIFIRAGGSGRLEVEKAGRKYFHIKKGDFEEKIQSSDGARDTGVLRLTFKS